ncbi:preprotein translocase subunit SecE [Marasmitruncus massiliensis]|jgi:preprotein translocase subunit SecE|uniref:preprotein translocase subunit SecE n=1 Tax=Marasmitruncus massiliensis TaxID=1944642 RepID=UPI000C798DE9|nr:preprotein translocase subunit SecE [Marasmitruncus massiliensis]MBE6907604.1 preprotein translocase subunit SecE [Oscillospiraceae bacterium]
MADNAVSKKPGFIAKAKRFFRDVKGEFKKIVWPGKSQIINNTIIVLVVIVISGIFVGGFDILVSYLVKLLLSLL